MASLEDFIGDPSEAFIEQLSKGQLLQLAAHYEVEIPSSKRLKVSRKLYVLYWLIGVFL